MPHSILFVLPDFAGGGAERVALQLIAALDLEKHTPHLTVFVDRGPLKDLVPEGVPLTDHEFNNFFTLIVAAGNDTTRYTMTHALWTLMNNPELWDAWKANPDLTTTAVEEILRTSSVTMHFRRTATRDVEMRGKTIKAGDRVAIWFNAANHDPDGFENPYRYDLARASNDHMAFGRNGPHLCLGAWLARMEVRLVFDELMKRVERFESAGEVSRLRSNFIAGIKHLPVRVVGAR